MRQYCRSLSRCDDTRKQEQKEEEEEKERAEYLKNTCTTLSYDYSCMNMIHKTSFYTIIPKEDLYVNAPIQETEQVQRGERGSRGEKKEDKDACSRNAGRTSHLLMSTRGRSFGFE